MPKPRKPGTEMPVGAVDVDLPEDKPGVVVIYQMKPFAIMPESVELPITMLMNVVGQMLIGGVVQPVVVPKPSPSRGPSIVRGDGQNNGESENG